MKKIEIFDIIQKTPAKVKRIAGLYKNHRFAFIYYTALEPHKYIETSEIILLYKGRCMTYSMNEEETDYLSYYLEQKLERVAQAFLDSAEKNKPLETSYLKEYLDEDIE